MKLKSLVLLVMALGCGLIAMLGVQQILAGNKAAEAETVKVLVAIQEIPPGAPLDEQYVKFEDYPKQAVPPGAITDPKIYEERSLKSRAYPGEVILEAKLGDKGAFSASSAIPKGMRLVTVPVNMTTANSGLIRPGDRVDILVTYKISKTGGAQVSRTKTVLEFIEVFAVDRQRNVEGSEEVKGVKAENLSVLATPEQANLLMTAVSRGTLQMALRHLDDKDQVNASAVDDALFEEAPVGMGVDRTPEPPPVQPPPKIEPVVDAVPEPAKEVWIMEIFEGESRRVEEIELNGGSGPASKAARPQSLPAADQPAAPSA